MSWSGTSLLRAGRGARPRIAARLRKNLTNSFQRFAFKIRSLFSITATACETPAFKTPARHLLRSRGFLTFARDCGTFARDCGRFAWDLEDRMAFAIATSRFLCDYVGVQGGGRRLVTNGTK